MPVGEEAVTEQVAARTAAREERQAARRGSTASKEAAARERAAARETARRAKAEARRAKASARRAARDPIVEAPRGPKDGRASWRRIVSILAVVLGAVGMVCSVVLAVGTLLVALGTDDGRLYDAVSNVCDVLVGPLRDLFTFDGANAGMKESLVAWGAASIGYLVIGVGAQSLLRATIDD
ncbi:MAG: hypothetical protein ABW075_09835 [Aeromicrobium sp.]